jgi:outer membrane lipoprotein-sorting protein
VATCIPIRRCCLALSRPQHRRMHLRVALTAAIALLAPIPGQAQLGAEIARQHAERAGERLAALRTLRTEGRIFIAGEVTQITTLAERPNRLRVDTFSPLRHVVQAYDGVAAPWISHTDTRDGAPLAMAPSDATDFIANADFDGPLVNFESKGYSVDYAGEEVIDGRRALKLLMMSKRDAIFFLWVDAENHEIVKRVVYRTVNGRRVAIETRFKDFRPVLGVLQPHRVDTSADGELLYAMIIDRMDGNVAVKDGAFNAP